LSSFCEGAHQRGHSADRVGPSHANAGTTHPRFVSFRGVHSISYPLSCHSLWNTPPEWCRRLETRFTYLLRRTKVYI
jgi:hypothetical protein